MLQESEASAPARANLLGEHTDYNFGYVMPTPLPYKTHIKVERANDNDIHMRSTAFDEDYTYVVGGNKKGTWTDYISGCVEVMIKAGYEIPGLSFEVDSQVPLGMGISSSAALTVGTLRSIRNILELDIDDVRIAELAHQVETDYVGTPCGIMDQMVCSTGVDGKALFLDTLTMKTELIDLPQGYRFCVLHSGVKHELNDGDGGYVQRVAECQKACELLGVESLRELTADRLDDIKALPDPINRRALHVFTENQRVLDGVKALKENDIETYGRLLNESHVSQRDLYEVSVPKIDEIVESAVKNGAIGARLTGGGFGGSVLALVKNEEVDEWWEKLSSDVKGVTLL